MIFDLSFQTLPKLLFETVQPTPLKDPKTIIISDSCLKLFDPDFQAMEAGQLALWLNGQIRLPGDQRISTRYAGHQFGVWAGQLGDGRAISLGELINSRGPRGERWEIQSKGSGLTPFSRMGDGKAVIRSSVREFLCSEAMFALGIPTTRALALITGNDQVQRETVERSALVARVFPSNLRFGHFEYCFHFGFHDELNKLIEYAHKYFYSHLTTVNQMLEEIVLRTADLIAAWQAVGFCHGVMNTDNMSFLGLTIDYGPFGFLEDTQLDHICNHSDPNGRYAYFQQPNVALWNLSRLLVCFTSSIDRVELERILALYIPRYEKSWLTAFRKKLGLFEELPDDSELAAQLLKVLHDEKVDFSFFFRSLSSYVHQQPESLRPFWEHYPQFPDLLKWLTSYDSRLKAEQCTDEQRSQVMKKTNPKYILRNYLAEEIIRSVEQGQTQFIHQWLDVLLSPYDEHSELNQYALPPKADLKNVVVSCSS